MKNNTTWDLVEDIEALRNYLRIPKWLVFGGSWGSTLALAYGKTYPENVTGFIIRGIYLGTPQENDSLFGKDGPAAQLHPDEYTKFLLPILHKLKGKINSKKILQAYYDLFHLKKSIKNTKLKQDAIYAWNRWEFILSFLKCANVDMCPKNNDSFFTQQSVALIENYYFLKNNWLNPDELLKGIERIKDIPCIIIHGRYDLVCPISSALKLKKLWIKANLIITLAGHASSDPENKMAIKNAVTQFYKLLRKTRKIQQQIILH
jgi:proline iminopeptidase